jgi:hypothetical protein
MQDLKELTQIIQSNKFVPIPTVLEKDEGKLGEFYKQLLAQQLQTDEEAAELLYGEGKDNAGYRKLRGQLKNLLIDAVLQLDLDQFVNTHRQKAQCRCYKDWAAIKILMSKHTSNAGISLCMRLLKRARKYEFTELVMEAASLLRVYYGTIGGDIRKFEQYNQLFKEHQSIWQQENLAEELYTELVIRYVHSKATQPEIHERALESFRLIAASMTQYKSYRLHFTGNLIQMMIPTSVNDYQNANVMCAEIIRFFNAKDYIAAIPLQIFWYQKIVCCLQLRQFAAAKDAIPHCLRYLEEGTFNWFKLQQLDILLCFHTKAYQEAYERFNHLIQHPQYATLPEHFTETIRIYSAYLYYLVAIDTITLPREDRFLHNFRVAKFVNDTPIFSKDKRGMHIPILIIQILLLILDRRYGLVIDKMEAIEKYCTRYLRKDDTFRSSCFIKMLLQMPLSNFHRANVERKTDTYQKRLREVPIELAHQMHEVEIIPYEHLWAFALDSLQKGFYTLRPAAIGKDKTSKINIL